MPFGCEALLRRGKDFVERGVRRFVEGASGFFRANGDWAQVLLLQTLVVLMQATLHEPEGPAAEIFDTPFFRLQPSEVVDDGLRVVPIAQWLPSVPYGVGGWFPRVF